MVHRDVKRCSTLLTVSWQPIPLFLLRESHGQRSLADYIVLGVAETDTAEATEHK